MTHRTLSPRSQSGNVLFLILIAVALFAALSYVVAKSSRNGNADSSNERMAADAAAFIEYTSGLQAHIQRMIVTGGAKFDGLNFGALGRGWTQPCNQTKCSVFRDTGGKYFAAPHLKNEYLIAPYQNSGQQFGDPAFVRVTNVGTNLAELVYYYQGLTEKMCRTINKGLGLGDIAPVDTLLAPGDSAIKYEFSAAAGMTEPPAGADKEVGDQAPELAGKTAFCFRNGRYGNSEGAFIQVLYPR